MDRSLKDFIDNMLSEKKGFGEIVDEFRRVLIEYSIKKNSNNLAKTCRELKTSDVVVLRWRRMLGIEVAVKKGRPRRPKDGQ